ILCRNRFIRHRRTVAGTISHPAKVLCFTASFWLIRSTSLMGFQVRAGLPLEAGPGIFLGDLGVPVVRGPGIFIGHFQEQQVGELLHIIAIAHAVIPQDMAEVPDFGDDGGGGFGHVQFFRLMGLMTTLTIRSFSWAMVLRKEASFSRPNRSL